MTGCCGRTALMSRHRGMTDMGVYRADRRAGVENAFMTTPWMRRAVLAAMDFVCWGLALCVILGVRLDFTITQLEWVSVMRYGITAGVLMVGLGYLTKFYRGRFLVGSFDEALG